MNLDKEAIRQGALELVAEDPHRVASRLVARFGVSRQVASGYLVALEREGLVEAEGSTRARTHRLRWLVEVAETYPLEGLEEHVVERDLIAPATASFPENVRFIWHYASTEMINNAIDHSGGTAVRVSVRGNALFSEVEVADDGIGIFVNIQRALSLADPREAILELAKGKLTTAPENHTGEGIFFASKMLDAFVIESHRLRFATGEQLSGSLVEEDRDTAGTRVTMRLTNRSPRTAESVFDAFSDPEEQTFDKTLVPLRLAEEEGASLVSRSQARRIARRLEKFRRVELDFAGIAAIGQGFADELFRVFATAHPEVRLVPVNTAPAVAKMIRRALAAASREG